MPKKIKEPIKKIHGENILFDMKYNQRTRLFLGLFHALGKVLYAKRRPEKELGRFKCYKGFNFLDV